MLVCHMYACMYVCTHLLLFLILPLLAFIKYFCIFYLLLADFGTPLLGVRIPIFYLFLFNFHVVSLSFHISETILIFLWMGFPKLALSLAFNTSSRVPKRV